MEKKYNTYEEVKAARNKANIKYKKKAYTFVQLAYHNVNDAAVLEWLNKQPSKVNAVRQLILKEVQNEKDS